MTDAEAAGMKKRCAEYERLSAIRDTLYKALHTLIDDDPNGPFGKGPFTGNTRESRQVHALHFKFTATRGGSQAVDLYVEGLQIEAYDLGKFLEERMRAKLKTTTEEIENL